MKLVLNMSRNASKNSPQNRELGGMLNFKWVYSPCSKLLMGEVLMAPVLVLLVLMGEVLMAPVY